MSYYCFGAFIFLPDHYFFILWDFPGSIIFDHTNTMGLGEFLTWVPTKPQLPGNSLAGWGQILHILFLSAWHKGHSAMIIKWIIESYPQYMSKHSTLSVILTNQKLSFCSIGVQTWYHETGVRRSNFYYWLSKLLSVLLFHSYIFKIICIYWVTPRGWQLQVPRMQWWTKQAESLAHGIHIVCEETMNKWIDIECLPSCCKSC